MVGEALVTLRPLGVPDPGAAPQEAVLRPAVELFADRAAAVQPGFRVDARTVGAVVEIVRRLDGLPLAIELAAARMRTLPVGEIAARLTDRFRLLTGGSRTAVPRHRTLRAVVEWSWDLLSPPERLLAERAAVFPAGLTAGAAAAVCADAEGSAGVPVSEVPELLDALVDKSLLETIREYGSERLAERAELPAMRERHARYFAGLVADLDPLLRTAGQLDALAVLRAEHDNVAAALRVIADIGDAQAALTLALDLGWYWMLLGRHGEAAAALAATLAAAGGAGDRGARLGAEVLQAVNAMAAFDGGAPGGKDAREHVAALGARVEPSDLASHPHLQVLVPALRFVAGDHAGSLAAMDTLVTDRDPWRAAVVHAFRARYFENEGDLEAVRHEAEAALTGFSAIGDRWGMASTLPMAAGLQLLDGDLDGALAQLIRARELTAEFGRLDLDDALFAAVQIADVQLRRGDPAAARAAVEEGRGIVARTGGAPEWVAVTEALGGNVERLVGDLEAARQAQERADATLPVLTRSLFGTHHGVAIVQATGAHLDLALGRPDAAAARLQEAYVAAQLSRDLPVLSTVGVAVAALGVATGSCLDAAHVLGAAARLRGADDPTNLDVRRVGAVARAVLGDRGFDEAYAQGRSLDRPSAQARLDPGLLAPDPVEAIR
jgi:hypothetical protein